jgi:tetratricopeptide (TPR) repeat protein
MQGNRAKAREAAGEALGMSPNNELMAGINGVAGSLDIMLANYDFAVRELSSAEENANNMFNKGLAYLLKKDYQNALTAFDEATELDAGLAKAYYGAAVTYARMQSGAKVAEMVKKAVDNDSSLKSKAATDLEFANYASATDFIDAIK